MARTVAGTLTLPVVGSPLANAEIFFTAKRTEATAILKGVSTSFKTDSSGAYSASIVNGYYAVSVSYSLPGVSQARRYPLGDVVVSDGGTVTLNALLAVNESAADPVDEALLQLVADAQAARDEAVAAAATLQYSTEQEAKEGTSVIGIMSPLRVWQAIAKWWDGTTSAWGRAFVSSADAEAARSALELGSAAVADIVGTVSESGGAPTGAIIERGSNANGEYVRYADGTQLCYAILLAEGLTWSGSGPFYTEQYTWTFPVVFSSPPTVSISAEDYRARSSWGLVNSTSPSICRWCMASVNDSTSGSEPLAHMVAFGKWF